MNYAVTAFSLGLFFTLISSAAFSQDSLRVVSPNGSLSYQLSMPANGGAHYEIQYNGKSVILPSALGLTDNITTKNWQRFVVVGISRNSRNETWRPMYGERELIPDRYQELIITLQDTIGSKGLPSRQVQIIARAYDEGVAFRYFFPESLTTQTIDIRQEATHFHLPPESRLYATSHAQGSYTVVSPEDLSFSAELPLTVRLKNGLWASLLHAGQTHFPRVRLRAEKGELVSELFGGIVGTSPFGTPWRVVMVAEKPTQLLENNYLTLNLNPPNQIETTDWIKPGKVMREITLSTTGAMKLIDFAAEQNLNYIHFDAGWYGHEYEQASDASRVSVDPRRNPVNELDLPKIIKAARAKGIGVILYVNHRALENQIDTIFPLYEKWGVAGVKFGFVHTGSHHWTAWMHEAVKKAAKHRLMVDIHDEYMPTGFSRTYPNLMTQEGVRGNEAFPDATHNTTLPFTRFLAGAADYTYCFNEPKLKNTKAHQLALSIVNYSPWQYLFWYGKPEYYDNREEIELWKTMPTVWDETRVPAGLPGEHITVVRRRGSEWYVGTVTNNEARKVSVSFDFLPKGKKYRAEIYEDDGINSIDKRVVSLTASQSLEFKVLPKGGVAVRLIEM